MCSQLHLILSPYRCLGFYRLHNDDTEQASRLGKTNAYLVHLFMFIYVCFKSGCYPLVPSMYADQTVWSRLLCSTYPMPYTYAFVIYDETQTIII